MGFFNIIDLGISAYEEALHFQEALFQQKLDKKAKGESAPNQLIFTQHLPVYTLGKSGDPSNLRVPIEKTDAEFYQTSRGGDITFHGPGQLTIYPIFDLADFNMGVRQYVESLELAIIDCLKNYGLKGERMESASGVWLDIHGDNPRKICAIGIKVSRGICMHGLAFNINTDLSYFENIIPCGIADKGVSSVQKELNKKIPLEEVMENTITSFQKYFN